LNDSRDGGLGETFPRSLRFGVSALALMLAALPVAMCVLPGAAMTSAERECCKKMAEQCGDMGTAKSHPCSRVTGLSRSKDFYSHFQRHNRLSTLAEALAAKRLPLHTPTQDAVDLPKTVQVVCGFQADELLDRLPSAYLVDPVALHPPCARDRLQQSQVALAQRPKDPCRKARILLRVTQALRPYGLIPPR
jgi:hypothetical protein